MVRCRGGLQAGKLSRREKTVDPEYSPGVRCWKTPSRHPNAGPGRLGWPLAGSATASERLGASMMPSSERPGVGSAAYSKGWSDDEESVSCETRVVSADDRRCVDSQTEVGLEIGNWKSEVESLQIYGYLPVGQGWRLLSRIPATGPGQVVSVAEIGGTTVTEGVGVAIVPCFVYPGLSSAAALLQPKSRWWKEMFACPSLRSISGCQFSPSASAPPISPKA